MGTMIFFACHDGQENVRALRVEAAPIEITGLPKDWLPNQQLALMDRRLGTRLSVDRPKSFNRCVEALKMAFRPKIIGVPPSVGEKGHRTHFKFMGHLSLSDPRSNRAEILIESRVGAAYHLRNERAFETAFDEFLLLMKAQISILYQPPLALINNTENLSDEQLSILLERLSFCREEALAGILKHSLSRQRPRRLRLRSLGVITELKLSMATDWLIDTIDLNDMEWTLPVIQTISHLDHPDAERLFKIMGLHPDPRLQKELQTVLKRIQQAQEPR